MGIQIYIGDDLKRKAKDLGINLSAEFRSFLEYRLSAIAQDAGGIDLMIKKKQLSKLNEKISTLNAEKLALEQQIRVAEEEIEKKEQQKLMEEKEKVEAMSKCLNCGGHLNDKLKKHTFTKGIVCNACFMSSDAEMVKKWNNG